MTMDCRGILICLVFMYRLGVWTSSYFTSHYAVDIIMVITILSAIYPMVWKTIVKVGQRDDKYQPHSTIRYVINLCSSNKESGYTLWQNFGLWHTQLNSSSDFVEACENLVQCVADEVDVCNGDRILDVGVGCGDQDIILATIYPNSSITGMEYSLEQVTVARERMIKHGIATRVHIQQGNASTDIINMTPDSFNKVLCIDAAYHFNTRLEFLLSAYTVLQSGGAIGLMDFTISFGSSWWSPMLQRITSLLFDIPLRNMYGIERYTAQMKTLGYININTTNISNHVIYGFQKYVQHIDDNFGNVFKRSVLWKLRLIAYTLVSLHHYEILDCYIITAVKQSS